MNFLNITLHELIKNKKGILFFTFIMGLFFFWFSSIFDPTLMEDLQELVAGYPEAILALVGGQIAIAEFEGFVNVYMLSFSWMYLGIYFILKISQDIPTEIEEKTIDIVLSKPMRRWEFVLGKFVKHLLGVILVVCIITGTIFGSIFVFPNVIPSEVNFGNIGFALLLLFLHMLSLISTGLVFSTILTRKKSLAFGFGTLLIFYIMSSFSGFFPNYVQNIKYASIFYYFDTGTILINNSLENLLVDILVLSIYSAGLVVASILLFQKRNIPV